MKMETLIRRQMLIVVCGLLVSGGWLMACPEGETCVVATSKEIGVYQWLPVEQKNTVTSRHLFELRGQVKVDHYSSSYWVRHKRDVSVDYQLELKQRFSIVENVQGQLVVASERWVEAGKTPQNVTVTFRDDPWDYSSGMEFEDDDDDPDQGYNYHAVSINYSNDTFPLRYQRRYEKYYSRKMDVVLDQKHTHVPTNGDTIEALIEGEQFRKVTRQGCADWDEDDREWECHRLTTTSKDFFRSDAYIFTKVFPQTIDQFLAKPKTAAVKQELSVDHQRLFITMGSQTVTFVRVESAEKPGYENASKDAQSLFEYIDAMGHILDYLKDKLRPQLFKQTYGTIQQSVKKIEKLQQQGEDELSYAVKQEFMAIHFLLTTVVAEEINEDRQVAIYKNAVEQFVSHVKHMNDTYYQFDYLTGGTRIISIIATEIRITTDALTDFLNGNPRALAKAKPAKKRLLQNIDELNRLSEELEVRYVNGDGDATILDLTDQLIDFFDAQAQQMIVDMNRYQAGSRDNIDVAFEKLTKGITILKQIRE